MCLVKVNADVCLTQCVVVSHAGLYVHVKVCLLSNWIVRLCTLHSLVKGNVSKHDKPKEYPKD